VTKNPTQTPAAEPGGNASRPAGKGVETVLVTEGDTGQRIDNFLIRVLKGVPKTHVYRLLRTGQVRVNGGRAKPNRRLVEGDKVRLPPVRRPDPTAPKRPPDALLERLEQGIAYEDDQLLVLDKPVGLAAHGGSGVEFGVIEAAKALRPHSDEFGLVHRLDRDTSGLLVVAKKRSALRRMHAALRERDMEKRYLALLAGRWPGGERRVDLPLEEHRPEGGERLTKVSSRGRPAVSVFRPIKRFADATLVEVDLETGRMHQIRAHAAHLGHPVLGDPKYGDAAANALWRSRGLRRMFLHAAALRFAHPSTGSPIAVEAALDEELRGVLEGQPEV
jgi:23S rRNA pseudouridine955/2504/2580 synthase